MADMIAELTATLSRLSTEALKLVLEFAKFLVKEQAEKKG